MFQGCNIPTFVAIVFSAMDKKRILVVDDIYTNRLLLNELVTTLGHEPVLANDGKEALAILKSDKIDLILMDVEMPVMNGIETTNHIRNELPFPENAIPIIALTAHDPDLFFDDYENVGFDDLITKPYSSSKLSEKLSSLLG
jgi:CheY-like chemotaxis protein